jgi:transcriptional regulator with XRE-family HTH domain
MAGEKKEKEFAARLKTLMKTKGIKNNKRLAEALGKSPPVTRKWVNGINMPTRPDDWEQLCDFFGVSADYLLLGRKEEASNPIQISLNLDQTLGEALKKYEGRQGVRRQEDKLILLLLHKFLSERVSLIERLN